VEVCNVDRAGNRLGASASEARTSAEVKRMVLVNAIMVRSFEQRVIVLKDPVAAVPMTFCLARPVSPTV
jgi:hypothetical protein